MYYISVTSTMLSHLKAIETFPRKFPLYHFHQIYAKIYIVMIVIYRTLKRDSDPFCDTPANQSFAVFEIHFLCVEVRNG